MWQEPIFDRTNADTLTARAGQSAIDNHKGALNYQDLNRIEQNFQYVVQHLFDNAMVVPHTKREYTETTFECVEQEVSVLPDGYTQLEYIESTGTQYIDTGVKPTSGIDVEIDFQLNMTNGWACVFGGRDSSSNSNAVALWLNDTSTFAFYRNVVNSTFPSTISTSARHHFKCTGNTANIDGNTVSVTDSTFTGTNSIYLFAVNDAGSTYRFSKCKLYSCKIYDNGTLIRDYVPCLNAEGVAGLYDLVERKFYGNSGTGEFRYVIKHKLPKGYTQVEYIQSSGIQFIDTDFIPNQDTRVLLEIEASATSNTSTSEYICGARRSSNEDQFAVQTLSSNYASRYGKQTATNVVSGSISGKFTIDLSKNVHTVNGITNTFTAETFDCPCSFSLFAMNNNGSNGYCGHSDMKLYLCKIYDNGTLTRDYVPCINSSGMSGLYDLANSKFYANAGTGTFSVGPEIKLEIETVVTLEEITKTFTDWQEANIPWKSEIDRIRENFNSLTNLFLRALNLPIFASSDYLMYSEVNDWERVALVGKTMFDNMEKEYVYSGTIDCGGDRLL